VSIFNHSFITDISPFWATVVSYLKGKEFMDSVLGSQRGDSR